MTHESTLSAQVQSFLDTLDWEDDHDPSPEKRMEMRIVEGIVDDVIASRETVTDNKSR